MSTNLDKSTKELYYDEVKNPASAVSQDFRPWFSAGGAIEKNEESQSPGTPTCQDSTHPGAFRVRGPGWEESNSVDTATVQIGAAPSELSGQTRQSILSATATASQRIPYPIDETPKDYEHCLQSRKSRTLILAVLLVLVGVALGVVFGVVLQDNGENNAASPPAPTSAPTITMSPTSPKSWENAGEIIVFSDGATMAMSPSGTRVAVLDLRSDLTSGGTLEESTIVRVYNEDEDGIWTQIGNFVDADAAVSLSLLGDRLAVGSVNASIGVTVYELEDNVWSRIGNVIEGDAWTVALAREGNVLAVEETSGVQLYELRGTDWVPNNDDPLPTIAARTNVGSAYARMAVDDSGTKLLVDQIVYQYSDGLDFFIRTGSLLESDPPDTPVSMSGDGTVLAIAQPQSDVNRVANSGKVTVFWFDGTEWKERGDSITGDIENELFGWSHSLSRNGRLITILNNPTDSE